MQVGLYVTKYACTKNNVCILSRILEVSHTNSYLCRENASFKLYEVVFD